ncbi:MAG: sulfite exporter TauE/SafE family protein [Armatimonadota bacterium]|nr:sulfite exporter TauE/SafE family protein [Armatimonadota bacterium]
MLGPAAILEATFAAFAAGAVNAVSGGGTLLTFPVLLGLEANGVIANATSTVALWPGVASAMWGYRGELRGARSWALLLLGPCLAGGIIGSYLLLRTPRGQFDRIAPFLVLAATLLFMASGLVSRWLKSAGREVKAADEDQLHFSWRTVGYLLFQLAVSIYGGYFGAGIGILMLAALGMMGLKNIHRMNGLKGWAAFCTNGIAVVIFAANRLIDWPIALVMAVASIAGGYAGARMARHVGQVVVRRMIIGVGLLATASLLLRRL